MFTDEYINEYIFANVAKGKRNTAPVPSVGRRRKLPLDGAALTFCLALRCVRLARDETILQRSKTGIWPILFCLSLS